MVLRLDTAAPGFEADFRRLLAARRGAGEDVRQAVAGIIEAVRAEGDAALIRLTERFDGMTLTPARLRVSAAEIEDARRAVPADVLSALDFAARRIEAFHERQKPQDARFTDAAGATLGWRYSPVAAAGLYVPGGKAAYPSSVLMSAIPARVAGVARIVMTVPAPRGALNPHVLAAAYRAGVTEIYRVGGAQAVAALAYGTQTIAPVDVIVGPGNAYVAEAKRQVFGEVGIDLIAGPSEILIIADGDNDPRLIAADLLSQAEHDESAQAILITDSAALAARVLEEIERVLASLPRAVIARASLARFGAVILVKSLAEAPALASRLAAEHVEILAREAEQLAEGIRHAGAIFLGPFTPEAIGDYVAGTSHVLPTARSARFSSGLSVFSFLTRTALVHCEETAFRALAKAAETLARAEGLDAHAEAIALRLKRSP